MYRFKDNDNKKYPNNELKRYTPFLRHQTFKFAPSYTHTEDIADIDRKYIAPIIDNINSMKFMEFEKLYAHMHKIGWFYNGIDIDRNHVFRNSNLPTEHFHLLKISADDSPKNYSQYRIITNTTIPYKAFPCRDTFYCGTLQRYGEEMEYLSTFLDFGNMVKVKRKKIRELNEGDFLHCAIYRRPQKSNGEHYDDNLTICVLRICKVHKILYSGEIRYTLSGQGIDDQIQVTIPKPKWTATGIDDYVSEKYSLSSTMFMGTDKKMMLQTLKNYLDSRRKEATKREQGERELLKRQQQCVISAMKITNRLEDNCRFIEKLINE